MLLPVKESETKTFFSVSQRENKSHNNTQEERVFKSTQLKPGLLPTKLMLISLMLMLMHKHVIEERMRGTKAIPTLDTADKKLSIVWISVLIHCTERVFTFSPVPFAE